MSGFLAHVTQGFLCFMVTSHLILGDVRIFIFSCTKNRTSHLVSMSELAHNRNGNSLKQG
jgi:hypothetical protein